MASNPSSSSYPDATESVEVSQRITLPDGRQLGYAEYGLLSTGSPIIYFPGVPASRFEGWLWSSVASQLHAWIISVERPGVGLSSPKPNRTILDFVDDVLHLVDHLRIQEFRILAVSGGGPYALACVKIVPRHQLNAVGIVAGLGPLYLSGTAGMGWTSKITFGALRWLPFLVRPFVDWTMVSAARDPNPEVFRETLLRGMMESVPEPDRVASQSEFLARGLEASVKEAVIRGGEGLACEGRLLSAWWGFELGDVPTSNLVSWYGTADTNCPVEISRRMMQELPGVGVRVKEGEGHLCIELNHAEEIMKTVLEIG